MGLIRRLMNQNSTKDDLDTNLIAFYWGSCTNSRKVLQNGSIGRLAMPKCLGAETSEWHKILIYVKHSEKNEWGARKILNKKKRKIDYLSEAETDVSGSDVDMQKQSTEFVSSQLEQCLWLCEIWTSLQHLAQTKVNLSRKGLAA